MAYIVIGLLLLILVVAEIILILILLVIEIGFVHLTIINLLVAKSFASEPVDSARDELLLDILTEMVVELEAFFDLGGGILIFFVVVVAGRLGGRKEVEEGLGGDSLLDNASLLRV